MKKVEKVEEREIMEEILKKRVPNSTYTYVRDLIFAAMITGLILKSINNSETIARIEVQIDRHEHWGENEQVELSSRLLKIEDRLIKLEIAVNGNNLKN